MFEPNVCGSACQAVGRFAGEGPLSYSAVVTFYFQRVSFTLLRDQTSVIMRRSAAVEGVGLPPLPLADSMSIFEVGHVRAPPWLRGLYRGG